jgi:DNA primase
VSEADVARWETSLSRRPALLSQLAVERGWRYGVIRELQLGLDSGGRVTIPIRNGRGELRGALRYQPLHFREPKMLAVRGTRLGLIPHPARETSADLLLVEGPADMIAARSHGLPAIAVPGTHAWRSEWAGLLEGRRVTVVMDCDRPGRTAARRIEDDLARLCTVAVIDLDPSRDDGLDLTDVLLDYGRTAIEPPGLARLHRTPTRSITERGIER